MTFNRDSVVADDEFDRPYGYSAELSEPDDDDRQIGNCPVDWPQPHLMTIEDGVFSCERGHPPTLIANLYRARDEHEWDVVMDMYTRDVADRPLPPLEARPQPQAPASRRRISLTPAATIKPRPIHWLWKDRLALGTLALLGGREGIGKSTVAYQLAADMTKGRLPGDFEDQPKAVIVVATEDSWEHTIVPRLMAAGADLARVFRVEVTTSEGFTGSLNLPQDIDALAGHVEDVDAALILLDPLLSRLDASLDTHKDAEVRKALEPMVALADKCRVAVLGLIHVNKGTSNDPLTLLMGSRAFVAVARAVLFVMRDPEDDKVRLLGQPKNNLGQSDELPTLTFTIESADVAVADDGTPIRAGRICWGHATSRTIQDAMADARQDPKDRTAVEEAAQWLAEYLGHYRIVLSAVVKAAGKAEGYSPSSLNRARHRINGGTHNTNTVPRTTYWTAPDLSAAELDQWCEGSRVNPVGRVVTDMTDTTETTGRPVVSVVPVVPANGDGAKVGTTDYAKLVEDAEAWLREHPEAAATGPSRLR